MRVIWKQILSILLLFNLSTALIQAQKIEDLSIKRDQESWKKLPKPIGFVNDFDGLYSPKEKYCLDSLIRIYNRNAQIEIAVVTIDTLMIAKDKFDNYILSLANAWDVGEKEKNNGILVAISKGYRKMRVQNSYGIEKLMTDEETKQIIDNYFITAFKKNAYYKGTLEGLKQIANFIQKKRKATN